MSFALAPALWGLLVLPVLVLLRILDRRPRVVVVPSLIPWRQAADAAKPEGRRRVLLDWPLVLQMAAAAAIVLGAAGPRLPGGKVSVQQVAVVLDNSASMGARTEDGRTRLDSAREKARGELQRLGLTAGALAVTAPVPRVIAGPGVSAAEVAAAAAALQPAAAIGDLAGAVAAARAAAGPDGLVLVISDDLDPIVGLGSAGLAALRVGRPGHNLGLVAATIEGRRAFAAVRNASPQAAKARLACLAGGRELGFQELSFEPGARQGFSFQLPADLSGTVELHLPPDDLEADNLVRLSAEPSPRPAFLGRPAPSFARALAAMGFPEPSGPAAAGPAETRLTVSCGQWPQAIPAGGFALVIDPPAGALAGVEAGGGTAPAEIRLGEGDPGFFPGGGGFSFRAPSVRKLKAGGGRVLLGTADQPAIVLSADGSMCVLAFDPEATEWVKHESFPVFLARLAERAGAFGALCRGIRPEGLLSDEETACRVAGSEIREVAAAERPGPAIGGLPLAPWLFTLALALLAAEWWLASRLPVPMKSS